MENCPSLSTFKVYFKKSGHVDVPGVRECYMDVDGYVNDIEVIGGSKTL
jgi:hypothetical protein